MANNKIQIKRSVANATVTGLSNGELAFTQASNTLHIGLPDGSGVLRIGGAQYPGTLTNSHALVANATGGIDKVITGNAVITTLWANGAAGTSGQVLVSNGSAVFWGTGTSGSNTYVQFNDSGVANGVAGFTFDKVSNTLAVSNTITTTNLLATGTVNGSTLSVGGWVIANNGGVYVSGGVNASVISVGTDVRANTSGVFTTGKVNGAIVGVGTQFFANTTQVVLSQGMKLSANGALGSANQVLRTDAGGTAYWADDLGDISSVTAGDGLTGGGSSGDITIDVGAGVGIYVNATSVGVLANNGIVANSTGTWVAQSNGISVTAAGVNVLANNGIVANSTGVWAKQANGIGVDASGINVLAGTGVHVNSSAVYIGQEVETTSNVTFANVVTTNITINGNTTLGDSTSDRINITASVTGNVMPTTNNTYYVGNNTMRWAEVHAGNVHAVTGYFDGRVEIGGDLFVTGNVTTVNVSSIVVSDPMLYLAGNNYTSDLVDIGLAANYNDGTNRHTGIFRDHTDGLWKIFYNLTQELSGNNDVDTSDASYRTATLQTFLDSGGLQTNSTHIGITANSTVNVAIVANTLTLSTALAGTSGGTGKATVTNNALLVGNSTNGYNELTLGTGGYVLQSNGVALVFDVLDGGSF